MIPRSIEMALPTKRRQSVHPISRSLIAAVTLLVLSSLTAFIAPATPAQAAAPNRQGLPVVAGTRIDMQYGGECTAGLVLRKSGILAFLSMKERATRYIIIAAHCVNRPQEGILVGDTLVGEVLQRDPEYDIAIARVEPVAHQQTYCSRTSFGGVSCTRSYTYTPRAVGRVILADPRTRGDGSIALNGTGSPAGDEAFCTSGSFSGVNCEFRTATYPRDSSWFTKGVPEVARNDTFSLMRGDSGGPVVSPSGKFYGIITDSGSYSSEPSLLGLMGYVDAAKVLRFANGYSIAPAS
ncbi:MULTISPECIES: trypsin-like peptidase domain-containing protein [Curtobacterium]|nr:trypsin-like peptidase domain-containing protein [Curtobacterium flaccumfaciens pv. flaccumfaciens]RXF82698.1 serine protease [Curtobacterium flaccumfaciens pv. flaccumfaciens]